MPDKARQEIVRQGEIGTYHCWSRCVQRAFLCGYDAVTGTDFNYRRAWMESLLEYQAGVFAVDVGSYNILSNQEISSHPGFTALVFAGFAAELMHSLLCSLSLHDREWNGVARSDTVWAVADIHLSLCGFFAQFSRSLLPKVNWRLR